METMKDINKEKEDGFIKNFWDNSDTVNKVLFFFILLVAISFLIRYLIQRYY